MDKKFKKLHSGDRIPSSLINQHNVEARKALAFTVSSGGMGIHPGGISLQKRGHIQEVFRVFETTENKFTKERYKARRLYFDNSEKLQADRWKEDFSQEYFLEGDALGVELFEGDRVVAYYDPENGVWVAMGSKNTAVFDGRNQEIILASDCCPEIDKIGEVDWQDHLWKEKYLINAEEFLAEESILLVYDQAGKWKSNKIKLGCNTLNDDGVLETREDFYRFTMEAQGIEADDVSLSLEHVDTLNPPEGQEMACCEFSDDVAWSYVNCCKILPMGGFRLDRDEESFSGQLCLRGPCYICVRPYEPNTRDIICDIFFNKENETFEDEGVPEPIDAEKFDEVYSPAKAAFRYQIRDFIFPEMDVIFPSRPNIIAAINLHFSSDPFLTFATDGESPPLEEWFQNDYEFFVLEADVLLEIIFKPCGVPTHPDADIDEYRGELSIIYSEFESGGLRDEEELKSKQSLHFGAYGFENFRRTQNILENFELQYFGHHSEGFRRFDYVVDDDVVDDVTLEVI